MAARLRRRSGMEPDMQNWLGFGILTKRWCLPARCIKDGCKNVFSAEDVIQAPNQPDGMKELYCDCWCTRFVHHPEYANGDPRNIAYIGKIIFKKRDVHYLNEIGIF